MSNDTKYVVKRTEDYSDELQHYGVMGMKWGVRRGRADKVYAKASKKLVKLDKKATKHQKKALKRTMKADKMFLGRDSMQEMAERSNRRAVKAMRKAEKLVTNMNKAFKDTPIKLTSEQVAIGRRYVDSINIRSSVLIR